MRSSVSVSRSSRARRAATWPGSGEWNWPRRGCSAHGSLSLPLGHLAQMAGASPFGEWFAGVFGVSLVEYKRVASAYVTRIRWVELTKARAVGRGSISGFSRTDVPRMCALVIFGRATYTLHHVCSRVTGAGARGCDQPGCRGSCSHREAFEADHLGHLGEGSFGSSRCTCDVQVVIDKPQVSTSGHTGEGRFLDVHGVWPRN